MKNSEKYHKLKVGDYVNIQKYKKTCSKFICSKLVGKSFSSEEFKNTVPWTYFISGLNVEEIVRMFNEKELQRTNLRDFQVEKVIMRKSAKMYVKWKGYDDSLNSWIDTKDIVI